MPERKNYFNFPPGGVENKLRKEAGSVPRPVTSLGVAELFELKQWLDSMRINIRQPSLQKGRVSAGYAQRGVVELGDGRIAFVPHQNNERIEGTPQEFLEALKTFE